MMPARGERRRASAGNTHDPWPCCGTEAGRYGRPKGGICSDCQELIAEGKAARTKATQAKEAGQVAPYGWTGVSHGWPRFYVGADFPADTDDELVAAFYDLVGTISEPAPADTPTDFRTGRMVPSPWNRKELEPERQAWPWVLDVKNDGYSSSWQSRKLVLMNPAARDAVARLYAAIRAALADCFQGGKNRGGSALMGLASGDLSMADFDETLNPDKRRKIR